MCRCGKGAAVLRRLEALVATHSTHNASGFLYSISPCRRNVSSAAFCLFAWGEVFVCLGATGRARESGWRARRLCTSCVRGQRATWGP